MALSGLLTFILLASVTGERGEHLTIAVARADIAAGTAITPALVERADLPSKSSLAGKMVSVEHLGAGAWVATRPIAADDPLRQSDLAPAGERRGLRVMSIPVKRENAAGGALSVGDRVDVISTAAGRAEWVVVGVQVVAVPPPSSTGGLTRDVAAGYYVAVEVDADQALALADAVAAQKIAVLRSTGAPPIARPSISASAAAASPSWPPPAAAPTPGATTPAPSGSSPTPPAGTSPAPGAGG
jgi:Flp pilus assembly protein CpaB